MKGGGRMRNGRNVWDCSLNHSHPHTHPHTHLPTYSPTHPHTHTHTHTPLPQEEAMASWRRIVPILSLCEGDLENSSDTGQQDDEDEHLSESEGVEG